MKKLLLLVLLLPLIGLAQPKIDKNATSVYKAKKLYRLESGYLDYKTTATPRHNHLRDMESGVVEMSSSGNAYTLIMSESTCMTANQSTGTIAYTHRGDPGVVGASTGDIISTYTNDGGWNFSDLVVVSNAAGFNNRYPSGVLYNPTGNTDPDNQYIIVCGPSHDGNPAGATWDHTYYGSMKLDGTNQSVVHTPNPVDGNGENYELFVRIGLSASDDGKFHVLAPYGFYDVDPIMHDTVTRRAAYLRHGTWNTATNSVDWTTQKVTHSFRLDSSSAHLNYQYASDYKIAWSQDGNIGYVYFLARDSANDQKAFQPIVYKTTDKGATWNLTPVQQFGQVQGFIDNCRKTRQGTTRPYFMSENDATVDKDGNLHMFAMIRGSSTDHPDSLNYSWIFPQQLYHMVYNGTSWSADLIDTIWSDVVGTDNTPYVSGTDAMGWDHRIQASRTQDGKQIFCFWSDAYTTINEFPELFGWGMDLENSTIFPDTIFTVGTDVEGEAFFPFVSDITLRQVNGSEIGYYTPVCIQELGSGPLDPVYHKLLTFTGWNVQPNSIKQIPEFSGIENVYPVPAKGQVNVDMDLKSADLLNIELVNLMGQNVRNLQQNAKPGKQTIGVDINGLESGLYILRISNKNASSSFRIVVE